MAHTLDLTDLIVSHIVYAEGSFNTAPKTSGKAFCINGSAASVLTTFDMSGYSGNFGFNINRGYPMYDNDGTDDELLISDPNILAGKTNFTVVIDILTRTVDPKFIFTHDTGGGQFRLTFRSDDITIELQNGGSNNIEIPTADVVSVDKRTQIVMAVDLGETGESNKFKLYSQGDIITTGTYNGILPSTYPAANSNKFQVWGGQSGFTMDGKGFEFSVYNSTKDATWVANNYKNSLNNYNNITADDNGDGTMTIRDAEPTVVGGRTGNAFYTSQLTKLQNSVGNVLDRSSTPSGTLTASLVTDTLYGTLNLNSDGTFDYTSDGDSNRYDYFVFKANNGSVDSNLAVINIDRYEDIIREGGGGQSNEEGKDNGHGYTTYNDTINFDGTDRINAADPIESGGGATLHPALLNGIGIPSLVIAEGEDGIGITKPDENHWSDPASAVYLSFINKVISGGGIDFLVYYGAESDITNSVSKVTFKSGCTTMITNIRTDLNIPNLPIFFILPHAPSETVGENDNIRDGLTELAVTIKNMHILGDAFGKVLIDFIHIDRASQDELGTDGYPIILSEYFYV